MTTTMTTAYDIDALYILLARQHGAYCRLQDALDASAPYFRLGGSSLPGARQAQAETRAASAALDAIRAEIAALLGEDSTEW
jgi:hypothetical protein